VNTKLCYSIVWIFVGCWRKVRIKRMKMKSWCQRTVDPLCLKTLSRYVWLELIHTYHSKIKIFLSFYLSYSHFYATPRGQRVNAAWSTNFWVSVNKWRAVHFRPARWQRAVNARQASSMRAASCYRMVHPPTVEGLRVRQSGDTTELI
jgi:hypothetical protein